MDKSTREQLVATKFRLHRLTEEARGTERERVQAESKAQEDAEYLRRHNKTVRQVLNQAAKIGSKSVDDKEEEEESEEQSRNEDLEGEEVRETRLRQKSHGGGRKSSIGAQKARHRAGDEDEPVADGPSQGESCGLSS